ncbi:hypothetical protein K7X08_022556 [Anisodus acutangulus]|uniref:Aminotransferase class I/classII large domain-containing protein n=1 Tax=Anisodus acutangulus TaxID=402998 RepID=A0A9Q1MI89_9SOLA|nr:hypothetical protein K7X08_022556 [Anisodus acutangulus]
MQANNSRMLSSICHIRSLLQEEMQVDSTASNASEEAIVEDVVGGNGILDADEVFDECPQLVHSGNLGELHPIKYTEQDSGMNIGSIGSTIAFQLSFQKKLVCDGNEEGKGASEVDQLKILQSDFAHVSSSLGPLLRPIRLDAFAESRDIWVCTVTQLSQLGQEHSFFDVSMLTLNALTLFEKIAQRALIDLYASDGAQIGRICNFWTYRVTDIYVVKKDDQGVSHKFHFAHFMHKEAIVSWLHNRFNYSPVMIEIWDPGKLYDRVAKMEVPVVLCMHSYFAGRLAKVHVLHHRDGPSFLQYTMFGAYVDYAPNSKSLQLYFPMQASRVPLDVERAKHCIVMTSGGLSAYGDSRGIPDVRKDIAGLIKRHGYQSNQELIFLKNGASRGVMHILNTVIRSPPDEVFVPVPQSPLYTLYSVSISLFRNPLVLYYLGGIANWGLDVTDLRQLVAQAQSNGTTVRTMVIINPGTPIGQCLTEANLPQILQRCYQENSLLLGDEVYHHSQIECPFISARQVLMDMRLPVSKELQLTSFHIVSKRYWGEYGQRRGYFELNNLPPKSVEENDKVSSISLNPNVSGQIFIELMVIPPKPGDISYDQYVSQEFIGRLQIASGVLLCGVFEFEKSRRIFSLTQRIAAYFSKAILYGFMGFGYGIIGQEIANLMQLWNSYRTLFGQLGAAMDDVEAAVSDAIVLGKSLIVLWCCIDEQNLMVKAWVLIVVANI